MQTDILQKQLQTSLQELKIAIEKFEKHPSPSTQYAEQLHSAIHQANKLVSAFLVLKEHKDVSPDLNLHLKLMNAPTLEEKTAIIEPIKEQVIEPAPFEVKEDVKPIEEIKTPVIEKVIEPIVERIQPQVTEAPITKELPRIAISINDKFRFINELFAANAVEYNIAIEQINAVNTLAELNNYLNGLKQIYAWKEDNEVVKNLFSLAQKRFS
ncbi:MAG TPA: hypothetical protein PKZ75_03795 [Bacteroidia bacterium]|nr:hypothetical protein [Bacteroidia bacterium]